MLSRHRSNPNASLAPQSAAATPARQSKRWKALQQRAFILTYCIYIMFYFSRKPYGTTKTNIAVSLALTTKQLGWIDTAFLFAYAAGQFILSPLGDKYGPRTMTMVALFGCSMTSFYISTATDYMGVLLPWTICGFFQAVAFPLMMKALSPWFSASKRGQVIGFWTTCQQIGGVLAVSCAGYLADSPTTTWRESFLIPGLINMSAVLVVYMFMIESPSAVGLAPESSKVTIELTSVVKQEKGLSDSLDEEGKPASEQDNPSFWDVLWLPGLMNIGAGYFCLKLARYTMLGWLPMYLVKAQGYSVASAAYMSTLFDIGGAFGSVVCGYLSTSAERRMRITFIMCILTGVCIASYGFVAGWGLWVNALSMALAGFMVAGPDSIMGGSACADLCEKSKYGSSVLTTVTGIVNGMGSLGAILSGIMPVIIFEAYGWKSLFVVVGALAILGGLLILPVIQKSVLPPPTSRRH